MSAVATTEFWSQHQSQMNFQLLQWQQQQMLMQLQEQQHMHMQLQEQIYVLASEMKKDFMTVSACVAQSKVRHASVARPQRRERQEMQRARAALLSGVEHATEPSGGDEQIKEHGSAKLSMAAQVHSGDEPPHRLEEADEKRIAADIRAEMLQTRLDQMQAVLLAMTEEATRELCAKDAALAAALKEQEKAQAESAAMKATAEAEVQKLRTGSAVAQDELQSEISRERLARDKAEKRFQAAEAKFEQAQEERRTVVTGKDAAEAEVDNLRRELAAVQVQTDAVINRIQAQSDALQAEAVEAQSETQELAGQWATAQASVDIARAAEEQAHANAVEHQQHAERVSMQLREVQASLENARGSEEQAWADLAEHQRHAEQVLAELQETQAKHSQVEQEVKSVHDRLQVLREELTCPITHQFMQDPVVAADGHCYERSALLRWLSNHSTSPMTNSPLAHRSLVPNLVVSKVMRCLHVQEVNHEGRGDDESNDVGSTSSANPQDEPPVAQGALLEAVAIGDRAACLTLLAQGVPDINARMTGDQSVSVGSLRIVGGTILHLAAARRWVDVCRVVLAAPDFHSQRAQCDALWEWGLWMTATALRIARSPCFGPPSQELCEILAHGDVPID